MGLGVTGFFTSIGDTFLGWMTGIANWEQRQVLEAKRYVDLWYDQITGAFKSAFEGLTSIFDTLRGVITNLKNGLINEVQKWLPSWLGGSAQTAPLVPPPAIDQASPVIAGAKLKNEVSIKTSDLMKLSAAASASGNKTVVINQISSSPTTQTNYATSNYSSTPSFRPMHGIIARTASFSNGM
jgi:hypothetical protein